MKPLQSYTTGGIRGGYLFWCPGCEDAHAVNTAEPDNPKWTFNGNEERPTFSPSILVRTGHYVPGHKGDECWCTYNAAHPDNPAPFTCGVCHSFVTDGKIQFLGDCTHSLAGKTVDLPEWDTNKW